MQSARSPTAATKLLAEPARPHDPRGVEPASAPCTSPWRSATSRVSGGVIRTPKAPAPSSSRLARARCAGSTSLPQALQAKLRSPSAQWKWHLASAMQRRHVSSSGIRWSGQSTQQPRRQMARSWTSPWCARSPRMHSGHHAGLIRCQHQATSSSLTMRRLWILATSILAALAKAPSSSGSARLSSRSTRPRASERCPSTCLTRLSDPRS